MQVNKKWCLFIMPVVFTNCNTAFFTCGYKDGSYNCNVHYENHATNEEDDYVLTVKVKDCAVVEIDFTNGGKLDEKHIVSTDIKKGEAHVKDDRGRDFYIYFPDDENDRDN